MPRVADYSILVDEWWTEGHSPDPIEFTVPHNINKDSRSILGFKLRYWNFNEMTITVRLNSVSVWHWTVPSTTDATAFRYIQEVIPKGLPVPGTNRLTVESESHDYLSVGISDVVLWWQADI
jgi:hypothetical protein